MKEKLLALVKSKKFISAVVGSAVCTALSLAGAPVELVQVVAGLFGVHVASQGYVDGKK